MAHQARPFGTRWQAHLAAAGIGLLVCAGRVRALRGGRPPVDVSDPELARWLAERRSAPDRDPGQIRLSLEGDILRVLTSLWLAWRSVQLDRARSQPEGRDRDRTG